MTTEVPVLRALQDRYGRHIERAIDGYLAPADRAAAFSGMMRYQLGWVDERLRPTEASGGKRFRPLICLLVCDTVGGDWEEALPVAVGIELVHNFSLVHDDIQDQDPARHHRPTVWKVWGAAQALNAGDGMFALATRAVLHTDEPETALELTREFQQMALDLTCGQFLDMSFEHRLDVSHEEYLRMIALKSAAIIRFSAWAGARVGRADASTLEEIRAFGENLGLAFQIYDDIMGIWGTPERTGKEPASDVRNRKKSLPVLIAFERARGEQATVLRRFYERESNDVETVVEVIQETDARPAAASALEEYRSKALAALQRASLSPDGRQLLSRLAHELTDG